MNFENLLDQAESIAMENPQGFTLEIKTFELITSGIIVAYAETQSSFGRRGLRKCLQHAIRNDGYLGGWRNPDGKMQYDSCKVFRSLKKAKDFGRSQGQYAIFDLDRLIEIKL